MNGLKERLNTYIACEELDFTWDEREISEFIRLWNDGYSLEYIADYFERDQDEVTLLIIDQSRQGKIKPRENGIWGN